ncbi:MAG: hypothetical protein M3277_09570 [Actinomycetota bacterium]|nr:hypothetical protein [Actinomycetota bacterium]
MRRILSSFITGGLIGALVLGVAWATSGLLPVGGDRVRGVASDHGHAHIGDAAVQQASMIPAGERLPNGLFRVGTADISIAPVQYPDGPWLAHRSGDADPSDGTIDCTQFNESAEAQVYTRLVKPGCINTFDGKWATGVDDVHGLGLQARAMALSNGETTIAFATLDLVSWFYGYDPALCPDSSEPLPQDTCGSRAITHDLSAELERDLGVVIPPQNFVIAATHTHASPDTAKGAPDWYFQHVRDRTKQALTLAVEDMLQNPLTQIQTGAISAKPFNVDRRIVTRAFPDYELTWLRAVTVPGTAPLAPVAPAASSEGSEKPGNAHGHGKPGNPHNSPTPTPTPTTDPSPVEKPETIATLVSYSVHTTVTAGNAQVHSGFVGHLDQRLEELWGGNTLFIPGGLGDQTVVRGFGRDGHGYGLAELVVRSAGQTGYTLKSNEIKTMQKVITVPADNLSLVAANKAGVFVRDATIPGPHAAGHTHSHQQKEGARGPSCVGSSPVSARTPVGGFVIGTPGTGVVRDGASNEGSGTVYPYEVYAGDALAIMQAPGEIFSSISTITKDYLSRTRNVMVLGMANDHLGYIIPAEQYDNRSANAAGLAQPSVGTFNYEESLSTGRCTGDQIQNHLIEIGEALGLLGVGEEGSASIEVTAEDQIP